MTKCPRRDGKLYKHKSVAKHHVFDVMPEKDKGLKPVVVSEIPSIEGVRLHDSKQSYSPKPEHITAPSSSVGQSLLGRMLSWMRNCWLMIMD